MSNEPKNKAKRPNKAAWDDALERKKATQVDVDALTAPSEAEIPLGGVKRKTVKKSHGHFSAKP